jgi:hypothetical protein
MVVESYPVRKYELAPRPRRRWVLTIRAPAECAGAGSYTVVDIKHGRTATRLKTMHKIVAALEEDSLEVVERVQVIDGTGTGRVVTRYVMLPLERLSPCYF